MDINDKKLNTFISCLLHTWGGDTPPEAVWALTDFLKWLAEKHGTTVQYEYPELSEWPEDENIDPDAELAKEVNRIIAL